MLQILDPQGKLTGEVPGGLDIEDFRRLYWEMLRLRVFDERLLALQRAGTIGFYGPCTGEEASVVGSGYALDAGDWVFPALRQGGVLLLRGFPLRRYLAQVLANAEDVSRGRQMPCHFSSREHGVVSWSSCIGTQLPHATGAALAARLRGDRVAVLAYLGEGAASEPDFHSALNFAGVCRAGVVFFCQNNGWAISVPAARQSASADVAVKARAYGIAGAKVDGNDVLAVYQVVREALDRARGGQGGGPTLIEAVTYRRGPHSSSDDPSRYRPAEDAAAWEGRDPLLRLRRWLAARGEWSETWERLTREQIEKTLAVALEEACAVPPPSPDTLIEDVYADPPASLREHLDEVRRGAGGASEPGAFPL